MSEAQNGEKVQVGLAGLSREFATDLVGRVVWKQTNTVRTLEQRDEIAEAVVRWLSALSSDPAYAEAVMAAESGRSTREGSA